MVKSVFCKWGGSLEWGRGRGGSQQGGLTFRGIDEGAARGAQVGSGVADQDSKWRLSIDLCTKCRFIWGAQRGGGGGLDFWLGGSNPSSPLWLCLCLLYLYLLVQDAISPVLKAPLWSFMFPWEKAVLCPLPGPKFWSMHQHGDLCIKNTCLVQLDYYFHICNNVPL